VTITHYCDRECDYCYAGSTPEGQNATRVTLDALGWAMEEAKVFEVALGGGEPMAHPDRWRIIEALAWHHTSVSFSTARVSWIVQFWKSQPLAHWESVRRFGFTPDRRSLELVDGLWRIFAGHGIDPKRCCIQIPLGAFSEAEVRRTLDKARRWGFAVLLLGYKEPKRDVAPRRHDYGKWMEWVIGSGLTCVSIDTVLAAEFEQQLSQCTSRLLFHAQEGAFSMHIDAVDRTIGPSSFCPADQRVLLPDTRNWKDLGSFMWDWFQSQGAD
jgi:hypothetical protein